jgi:hypothetical protein
VTAERSSVPNRWALQRRDPESPSALERIWKTVVMYPARASAQSAMTYERGRQRTHTMQWRVAEVAYDDRGFWAVVGEGADVSD